MIDLSKIWNYFMPRPVKWSPRMFPFSNDKIQSNLEHLNTNKVMKVTQIRKQFPAIRAGRIVTNNAASTQIPDSLLNLFYDIAPLYENVHRGQSSASKKMTTLFEHSYKIAATLIGAGSSKEIIFCRGATEAINSVMYSLMTEFKNGDNIVTTYMEHNSNYVPWYGMTKEILPRFGLNVECRLAKFDKETGELDLNHLAQLVDKNTKLVCCSGASNFLGTKPPLDEIRDIASASGYRQPNGINRSYLLVDGAQLVPNAFINVEKSDIDFLAWSFHKIFAPVGVGALYAKEEILESMRPFQYGGDMIAEGQVTPENVGYNILPWKYTAGTPNIMGTVLAAGAIKFLIDAVTGTYNKINYDTILEYEPERNQIEKAMSVVEDYELELSSYLLGQLSRINGITIYGPTNPARRTALVAFNIKDKSPFEIAKYLDVDGIESRAGCHCATLAHHYLGLNPPASCRISPYIYNTPDEMESLVNSIKKFSVKRTLFPVAI